MSSWQNYEFLNYAKFLKSVYFFFVPVLLRARLRPHAMDHKLRNLPYVGEGRGKLPRHIIQLGVQPPSLHDIPQPHGGNHKAGPRTPLYLFLVLFLSVLLLLLPLCLLFFYVFLLLLRLLLLFNIFFVADGAITSYWVFVPLL